MDKELSKNAENASSANLTAVDFFHDEVNKLLPKKIITTNDIGLIWVQAKEMEKEQIVKAVSKGWNYHEDGFVSWMGEQYYNETYGGTNNV